MAARNLSIVAGRILKLLCSEKDIEDIGSRWGVPHEVLQGLMDTISKLAPVLLDAEKKSWCNRRVEDWLMELEDVVYDADNLLDELSTEAMKRSWMMTSRLKNMRQDINRVGKRLDEIVAKGRDLRLEEHSESQVIKPDKNTIVDEEILRREHLKLRIIKFLLDGKDQYQWELAVLPIVGTTITGEIMLAKDVFNDERVQKHFDVRIWVSVSKTFDLKKILTDILEGEGAAPDRTLEINEMENFLARETKRLLAGKLYLIVLNGLRISNYKKWRSLIDILTVGADGSTIIVTSSGSEEVARMTGTIPLCRLDFKSRETSLPEWSIVHGYPLVCLKTIARMSHSEISLDAEWWFFYKNELPDSWSANRNVRPLLRLFYDNLPSPLKHCFAYCSLFPKNRAYDVQTMIKLWMAQGFIEPLSPDQSLEDVGYKYVQELLVRFLFQAAEIDVRERVTKFQLNDLMYDLAVSVAGDHCRMLSSYTRHDIKYARTSHVSIDFDMLSAEDIQLFPAERIRSILPLHQSQQQYKGIHGIQVFDIITSRFRFLWALDMHALGIKTVPPSIGKLKLLKYLDLSENEDITELPNSITKLLNLQTLRLSSCFGLKKLPKHFKNLVNLRHLEIDGCYKLTSLPRGISQLPNLQTLSQLVVSEDTSPNIGLNTLRKEVQIKNLGREKFDLDKYLHVVPEVRSLLLEWESHAPESDEHKAPLNSGMLLALEELTLHGFRGNRLFSSGSPSNLIKLSLKRCVKCENLPPLEQLSNLKVLVLDEITKLKYISDNASSSKTIFPSLQELWLTELPELQGWWRNGVDELLPSFHCLSKLVIEDCPKLATMPLFPTLEEGLVLDTTCWKPFQQTMDLKTEAQETPSLLSSSSSSPSSSPPLSKLKALHIVGIEDCKADEVKWGTLKSLRFLRFDCLQNLETLPDGLQQATSLQELHFWRCGIRQIPEWIVKLQKLQKLVIRICPRLESLPKEISKLRLLEILEIEECNMLLRRCEKDIGADWEKISSIRKLLLGRIYGK